MKKKIFRTIAVKIEDRLRSLVGQINADQRIIITVIILLLLGIGSIYMTVSSIYNMGKRKGWKMKIEHIERIYLRHKTDSTNHIKILEKDEKR